VSGSSNLALDLKNFYNWNPVLRIVLLSYVNAAVKKYKLTLIFFNYLAR
jgi:hypothetical protein